MRRTKEEAALTRDSLLRAALRVFSRQGYGATTLDDVAREAGVTRGAIYWHFGGPGGAKVELFDALLEAYSAKGDALVQSAVAEGGSFREVVRRILVRTLQAVESDPELRAVMELTLFKVEQTPDLAAGQSARVERGRALVGWISEAMRQGIAAGELRSDLDPADLARAFLSLQQGAIHLWLSDPASFSLAGSAEALSEVLVRGIERSTDSRGAD